MKTLAVLIFLTVASLQAQGLHPNTIMTCVSPKLRKLLDANPKALMQLSNSCSHAFRTNTVALNYFYSDDETISRCRHFYPGTAGEADVILCVRENQQPWDEFTSIIYELLNSKNQSSLEELMAKAHAGSIAKSEFVMGILRVEFQTSLAMREILKDMNLTKKERSESYFYARITGCPTNFEEHLTYQRKVSPNRDSVKEYELYYDEIRGNKN